jgi:hypothetical protein
VGGTVMEPCGTSCPSGYYPTRITSSPSCGYAYSNTSVTCYQLSGSTSIEPCGTSCPSGYYPTRINSSPSCGYAFGNTSTSCRLVGGTSLDTCGTQCPANYYPTSISQDGFCGYAFANTKTNCRQLVAGTAFEQCGTGCPSGYYPTANTYDGFCGYAFGNAKTSCSPLTGATQITVCGTACPDGYTAQGTTSSYSCGPNYQNTATVCRRPDAIAPSVRMSSPLDAQAVSGLVTLTASATDNVGVARVEIYNGPYLLGTVTTPPYQVQIDTRGGTSDGVYFPIHARAYDASGNMGQSQEILVIVSNRATSSSITWIQPQARAGFGPPGSLVVAGSASGGASSLGVVLEWRDLAYSSSQWQRQSFYATPDASGIWLNSIPNANASHSYAVRIRYGNQVVDCVYQGLNDITWCG